MLRELRNTVFMWAVFMIILMILSIQLINDPAQDINSIRVKTLNDCVPSLDNSFCNLEEFRNASAFEAK